MESPGAGRKKGSSMVSDKTITIQNHTITRDNRIVEWLDVRVILSREFGRSRYQTVRFRPDGHNILDLNCKVHAPLLKAGNIWFPRYAA